MCMQAEGVWDAELVRDESTWYSVRCSIHEVVMLMAVALVNVSQGSPTVDSSYVLLYLLQFAS